MIRTSPSASRPTSGHPISPFISPLSALGVAAALAVGLVSTDADALTLGRLNVQSALGEPLRAEIEVTEIGPGEADGLRVEVASRAAFQAAGVSFNDALSSVRTALQRRADGRYVVRLTGARPISEPFVDLLLEANWASGRIVRDYTLLLDPPTATRQATAVPVAPIAPIAPATSAARPQVVNPQPRVAAAAPAAPRNAPAPAATPVRARAESTGDQQVTIQRGETLGQIAAAHKPADVSLDQMLVALLRANPDAFINGNINRVKAGAVLQIPTAAEAASLPAAEARRTVVAQSRDFSQYRQRLAENAPASQVAAADRQASGRLQANVQDRNANAAAPDRLTIAQGGTAARAEERIAQTRQAQESANRVSELQRNIEELNRLQSAGAAASTAPAPGAAKPAVAGASSATAQTTPTAAVPGAPAPSATAPAVAQAPAAPATPATPSAPAAAQSAAAPAASSAPVAAPAAPAVPGPAIETSAPIAPAVPGTDTPASSTPSAAAPAPDAQNEASAEPTAAPATPAPAPRPRVATPPAPPPPSLLDELLENPIIPAGGAIALLLLGFLAYRLRNRKKSDAVDSVFPESKLPKDSFFNATGGESVDTSSRSSSGASSLSYSPSQLDAGDVDPVAEADVYLAYGRDLQAEEILREALRTTPERTAIHLKLLEIHAKRRDLRAFEALANDVRGLTGGGGSEWSRVIDMGRELDPGNPLYQGSAAVLDSEKTVPLATPAAALAASAFAVSSQAPSAEPPQAFVPSVAPLDFDLNLSMPPVSSPAPLSASQPAPAIEVSAPAPEALDFTPAPSYELPRATSTASPYESTARSPLLDPEPLDNDFETAPGELDALSGLSNLGSRNARAEDERSHDATMHAGLPGDSGFIEFDMTALSGISEPAETRPNRLEDKNTEPLDLHSESAASESPQAIKMSLARELHALGDAEGARSLLEEVVGESSGELRSQAQRLLAELH